ncbi:MAG: glycoside hydrolase [Clostridia bacterium]|nr:glycoside hydrolase [Clostridia bacterium]
MHEREYIPDPALMKIKDRKKAVRSVFQALFLLSLVLLYISTVIDYPKYKPYQQFDASEAVSTGADNGFISISYTGVARGESADLIAADKLEAHLSALKNSGYVTITQQDIYDYYNSGKRLPERALFLFFEDGRRDTAIFSQPVMERLNMCATVLTYANNLTLRGSKFLKTDDLKQLDRGSFWETGTNGYRLSYINVFDRYGRYLGQMNAYEFSLMSQYLGRDYNHYLMDFIRDKDDIPMESYSQMAERVNTDYSLMKEVYTRELGFLPSTYVLMHSNTGRFASNERVSEVNERALRATFGSNFNREGFSLNRADTDPYDLTRMQPQSYWATNHLLMRVWYDTGLEQAFVTGDEGKTADWTLLNGAAEHTADRMFLTSLPSGKGTVRLNQSASYSDMILSTRLLGNKLGTQRIYLRADEALQSYLAIESRDDVLTIYGASGGGETELYSIPFDELYEVRHQTEAENSEEARKAALNAKERYAEKDVENAVIISELESDAATASQEAYIPALDLRTPGDTRLKITLSGNRLTVTANGFTAVENMEVACPDAGYIFLEARCDSTEGGYSQRNLADDVYDAKFVNLLVTATDGKTKLYDYLPSNFELFLLNAGRTWDSLVDWFIDNL